MTRQATEREAADTLWQMIKGMRTAMMTTLTDAGHLHSRPMGTLPHAGFDNATLWFFTDVGSDKASEIERHWRVNLAYADPDARSYVSVSGVAEIVRDPDKIRHLWRDVMTTWFPKGPDAPTLALIKVTVDSAEYWDSPSGAMVRAYGYVKAKLTGERPDPGENARVAFQ
ncbi:pyridoxamine 5'-phosphate oxidase family protein [Azospirillum sp. TSO22-1]|uniref:pyridoxamine 5'-phosphate oxidase family protein n=1 Tax=Azospirillum sp. TSO22-1 TaxID=716789 RepID=UPI000D605385|nr:pyridoxamine 5'-phosphate oxidase family protein [Azospirillum sp. TSO22-1]PWC43535.1 pyridoxamine 5'-phosphate oxidase [Azospirillum sp. TSO22-1]